MGIEASAAWDWTVVVERMAGDSVSHNPPPKTHRSRGVAPARSTGLLNYGVQVTFRPLDTLNVSAVQ